MGPIRRRVRVWWLDYDPSINQSIERAWHSFSPFFENKTRTSRTNTKARRMAVKSGKEETKSHGVDRTKTPQTICFPLSPQFVGQLNLGMENGDCGGIHVRSVWVCADGTSFFWMNGRKVVGHLTFRTLPIIRPMPVYSFTLGYGCRARQTDYNWNNWTIGPREGWSRRSTDCERGALHPRKYPIVFDLHLKRKLDSLPTLRVGRSYTAAAAATFSP